MKGPGFIGGGVLILLLAANAPAAVTVRDAGWQGDGVEASRSIKFDTGKKTVVLQYRCWEDPAGLKAGQTGHGRVLSSLGMFAGCGWYGNGFVDVEVNGEGLGGYRPEISASSAGTEAQAVYTWDTPQAVVVLTIALREGDEKLFVRIRLSPHKDVQSLRMVLLCYPSSYALGEDAKFGRDRWISTGTRDVRHDTTVTLGPEEFWVLYYDKIWDRASRGGDGPCALLFPPGQPREVTIALGAYAVFTHLTYAPSQREINCCLWPAFNVSNQDALTMMCGIKASGP